MQSQSDFDIRLLDSLRRASVALRERDDREAREYQSDPGCPGRDLPDALRPAVDFAAPFDAPFDAQVIPGHALRPRIDV
jgi:hypothetical protein